MVKTYPLEPTKLSPYNITSGTLSPFLSLLVIPWAALRNLLYQQSEEEVNMVPKGFLIVDITP